MIPPKIDYHSIYFEDVCSMTHHWCGYVLPKRKGFCSWSMYFYMYQSIGTFDCGRCCRPSAIDDASIDSSIAVIWKERNFKRLQMQVEITVTDFWTLECVKSWRVLYNFNKFTLTKVFFTILFHLLGWNQWYSYSHW